MSPDALVLLGHKYPREPRGRRGEGIGRIQRDLSRDVVVAIEGNLFELYSTFAQIPNARVNAGPDMLRVKTGLPHELLNAIFRARIPEDDPRAAIDAALEIFRSDRTPMTWWVGPSTEPPHLGKYLENSGLSHIGDVSGMAIDLADLHVSPAIPRELSIIPVRDEATLQMWMAPLAPGYGMPQAAIAGLYEYLRRVGFGPDAPFRHYLGMWNGAPVATASLFLGAGVAGAYINVVPEYRKQGVGAAMSLISLRAARAAGYRVGITHVPEYRLGFQRRLGFKPFCTLALYVPKDLVRGV